MYMHRIHIYYVCIFIVKVPLLISQIYVTYIRRIEISRLGFVARALENSCILCNNSTCVTAYSRGYIGYIRAILGGNLFLEFLFAILGQNLRVFECKEICIFN